MNALFCPHPRSSCTARWLLRLLLSFSLLVMTACASNEANLESAPREQHSPANANRDYRIQIGDQVDVKLFFNPELNDVVLVRPDGKISLQLLDDVQAAGLTPAQLDDYITRAYAKEVKNPVVTVILRSIVEPRVYVGGDVKRPGYVPINMQTGALQAIVQAGGFLESADKSEVHVLRKGPDNRPVPFRLDIDRVIEGTLTDSDYPLESTDVIYVPRRGMVQVADFMHQMSRILLLNGFFLGIGI